ncbi:hypothetical protein SAMN05660413_01581 [Salegentibacter flavus]|uniref:Uncharacterized protein n=2 Tax=Flavobacteriaceae TaxID=49546 RepID=A0A1I4ZZD5_9FLAO|nr:hypothetical protein SAMN05660413_01581 [Salegentibacter flavus]
MLSLLLLYGQQAFAFSLPQFTEDSDQEFNFQTKSAALVIFFQENTYGQTSEYSENFSEYIFGTGSLAVTGNFHFRNAHSLKNATKYLQDHKHDLKHKIFPFHFFW